MTDKIKGYRELSTVEISLINEIKTNAEGIGDLLTRLANLPTLVDLRWLAIAKTDLQKGFMAAVRAVAKPETF